MRSIVWYPVLLVSVWGMLSGCPAIARAQSATPPAAATCEQQLKDAQVKVQIVANDREVAQTNWAHLVPEVERLTAENTRLKHDLDEARKAATPPSEPTKD